jgi:hypothetical protein
MPTSGWTIQMSIERWASDARSEFLPDRDGKITHYTYDGNVGGCGQYAHELDEKFYRAQGILDF